MKEFFLKHKIISSIFIMIIVAIIGTVCVQAIRGYDSLVALMIIWWIPAIVGLLCCIVSGLMMFFQKPPSKTVKNTMLIGLWLFMVSGGSCAIFWGIANSPFLKG